METAGNTVSETDPRARPDGLPVMGEWDRSLVCGAGASGYTRIRAYHGGRMANDAREWARSRGFDVR